jgi:hypothetical protein
MDVFDRELLRFWKIANKLQLRYIMIGGVATNFHGYQRTTADIDIWVEDSESNRDRLRLIFRDYGWGDFESFKTMQFVAGWTSFHFDNGIRLDIMTSVKGLENAFEYYLERASIATIYDTDVPFLHINHLIESKEAADRPKDKIDVAELYKIKGILDGD